LSHRSQETDAQGYPFAGFSPPALDPNMQEDRQPNETRMQRKGDHRVPKVQSSANPRHSLHRSSRPSSYPLPRRPNNPRNKKLWHRKLAPRGDDAGFVVTSDDLPRGQGSNRRRGFSPPPTARFEFCPGQVSSQPAACHEQREYESQRTPANVDILKLMRPQIQKPPSPTSVPHPGPSSTTHTVRHYPSSRLISSAPLLC